MALQFQKQEISCLRNILTQVQNLEQTQELRIPEGMPGVGQIPGCWGQVLIRSKEWNGDSVRISGGVMMWLLYLPEDGGEPRTLESWIPFQTDWDLPRGCREGWIRIREVLRYADARPVSAGKVLLRAGIGLQIQCWSPDRVQVSKPEGQETEVEVLTQTWPVLLAREAGEKAFQLEETLTLPASLPKPEALVYGRITGGITDKKVLGNKLVFRGSANVHLLYRSAGGQLHGWDFELPFSQFAQLEGSFLPDAAGDVQLAVTAFEISLAEDGDFRIRAGLTGQFLITQRELLETAADAYSPLREIKIQQECLQLPALLEERMELVREDKTIPVQADVVTDAVFLPDFPKQRQEGNTLTLTLPGMVQLLWYNPEGQLQSTGQRFQGELQLKSDQNSRCMAIPQEPRLQVTHEHDEVAVKAEIPVQLCFSGESGINMVTELQPGEPKALPENRPSLILRRAGRGDLWELARAHGSRVSLIRSANGLEGEPEDGQMLLIPVV